MEDRNERLEREEYECLGELTGYNPNDPYESFFEEETTCISEAANRTALIAFCENIKLKILSGEYKLSLKRKRSRVWDCFAKILNENDEEIDDFVMCKQCQNIYKYFEGSTSNLVRHKCFAKMALGYSDSGEEVEVSDTTKMEGLQIFSQWVIENGKPLRIIEDTGFKKVAKFLISVGAEYGKNVNVGGLVPHSTAICRNIEDLYPTYFGYVKAEVKSIKSLGYALTSDVFIDNYLKKSYISLTIHYIYEGNLVVRLLGLKSIGGEKCTGEHILHKTHEILKEFDLPLDENTVVVTNRSSNMTTAYHTNKHIFCINHILNSVLQKAIHDDEDVTNMYRSCIKLLKYLKSSNLNESLSSTIKNFGPTRWNDWYYLFATVKKNWTEIGKFLQEQNNMAIINDININHVTAVNKVLETFEEASKKLEGETYPTMHLVYAYVHRLQKSCTLESTDSMLIRQFKTKLANYLRKVAIPNLTSFHKISLYLFPPTKKLILFEEYEKRGIKEECKKMMSVYLQNQKRTYASNSSRTSTAASERSLELFSDFVQRIEIPKTDDKIEKEINIYENLNVHFCDDFNVIQWWESHKEQFPLLYRLSCTVLATPASSGASEKYFLTARNLIFEKRCVLSLDKNIINKIMFLHSNMESFD